jgi:hypothetical protein
VARRKVVYVADGKDAAKVKEFADFLEAHGGEAATDASIKLANEAVNQVRREEARNNFQIKGRRYIFLKNVDHLTPEEKEALSRLEAQNLDTIQAMQIRMRTGVRAIAAIPLQVRSRLHRSGSSIRARRSQGVAVKLHVADPALRNLRRVRLGAARRARALCSGAGG